MDARALVGVSIVICGALIHQQFRIRKLAKDLDHLAVYVYDFVEETIQEEVDEAFEEIIENYDE